MQTSVVQIAAVFYKNSSGDEIANVTFYYDDIVHFEVSAYAR